MSDYGRISKAIVKAIADALRYCNGNEAQYTPGQMPNAVRLLKKRLTQKTITRNGVYIPTSGYDGFDRVTVNVQGGDTVLVEKNITANGEYSPSDDNADGYSSVSVAVPNTYSAADEGKVVSGGQLVEQTGRSVSANGTYDTTENNSVIVNVETGALTAKDVNFIDCDGTIVYAYTAEQFAELTGMPANPSHAGLIAQGWNWTLADAQAHVASHRKLFIGQMYVTDDNKTRLYIHLEQGRLEPTLTFDVSETRNVVIDWGDGNQTTVSAAFLDTISKRHQYSQPGDYVISLYADGTIKFSGDSNVYAEILGNGSTLNRENACYRHALKKVELGNNVAINQYAFAYCRGLSSITIPQSISEIANLSFYYCISLKSATIPNAVTAINGRTFQGCSELSTVSIPKGITSIGDYAFSAINLLKEIVFPDSVESFGTFVFYQSNITSILLPPNITVMTSSLFRSCFNLSKIELTQNITTISSQAFYDCQSLATITIPSAVTSIAANAFYNCAGLGEIHFEGTTPPTISNASAWTNIQADCKIYVPTGTLSAYTSAANYPDQATYTYIEE